MSSNRLLHWIDQRFPLTKVTQEHFTQYYAPKNFNFWYYFGSLAILVLVNQLLTGIWLTMYYTPSAAEAFSSVEFIMRDVNFGWLIRYMHSTGASFFFIVVYCHMFRGLMYGSYQKPRELVWLIGMVLFFLLLMEAFFGYLLPWGQMSYWGAQVITSLFTAFPGGEWFVEWLRGDYTVAEPTLKRFFALHVIAVPLLLVGMTWFHIVALHRVGSNNPDGIDVDKSKDAIPFHPYYTVKDIWGAAIFLILFAAVIFFAPEFGGYFLEHANFAPANPLITPAHIAPVWYMTPYYAILRAVPSKILGVLAMGAAIGFFFLVPWLDRSPVRSMRYKGWLSRIALAVFVISFCALGRLGTLPVDPYRLMLARIFTLGYFAFFILMPFYSRFEPTKPLPDRLT